MAKKKHGDRRDGIWLRDLPAMNQIMPTIMPNRADNEAYIDVDVDLRPLEAYLARKNEGRTEDKITFFHVITAAIGKAFVLRPRMNRFICNHKVYQRRNITVAFVVKKKFEDKSEEGLAFLEFAPEDTIDTFHDKIMHIIHQTRRNDVKDASSGAMDVLISMPHFMTVAAVKAHPLAGSVRCSAGFHHRLGPQPCGHFAEQSGLHRPGGWLSPPW